MVYSLKIMLQSINLLITLIFLLAIISTFIYFNMIIQERRREIRSSDFCFIERNLNQLSLSLEDDFYLFQLILFHPICFGKLARILLLSEGAKYHWYWGNDCFLI